MPARPATWRDRLAAVDWVPDLGADLGSPVWWRGLATLCALLAAAYALSPGWPRPLPGETPAPLAGAEWEEARTEGIAPTALGATTGRRMDATGLVRPLAETPERPSVELTATLGEGDRFADALARAGVGRADADAAARLVAGATALDGLRPGTRIELTLGRRATRSVPRPLDRLAMRARFDLNVAVTRSGAALAMTEQPIAIDRTPLRIEGLVGPSLYRSARAAGAPAGAVESYIKALATRLSVGGDVDAADRFDLVIEQSRAATGETQLGDLLFAGLHKPGRDVELLRWDADGHGDWYDARGTVEREGAMGMPVDGHVTSTFGWRMHPILGVLKLHKGMDIGARYGSPIYAAIDGVVRQAGWAGGYGNFVKLQHGGGIETGYGHMSRIAVRAGEHVRRGEVIGYVGSTGLSTGPHLHWEVWRDGVSIDPRSVSFSRVEQLGGATLRAFQARLAELLALTPAANRRPE